MSIEGDVEGISQCFVFSIVAEPHVRKRDGLVMRETLV